MAFSRIKKTNFFCRRPANQLGTGNFRWLLPFTCNTHQTVGGLRVCHLKLKLLLHTWSLYEQEPLPNCLTDSSASICADQAVPSSRGLPKNPSDHPKFDHGSENETRKFLNRERRRFNTNLNQTTKHIFKNRCVWETFLFLGCELLTQTECLCFSGSIPSMP